MSLPDVPQESLVDCPPHARARQDRLRPTAPSGARKANKTSSNLVSSSGLSSIGLCVPELDNVLVTVTPGALVAAGLWIFAVNVTGVPTVVVPGLAVSE